MQDLYRSHTVFVSARPARENEGFELRAICMYDAASSQSTISVSIVTYLPYGSMYVLVWYKATLLSNIRKCKICKRILKASNAR